MTQRRVLPLAALAAVAMLASACGGGDDSSAAGSDLGLVENGTLTVCSDVPYAPFEEFDKGSDLGFKGFDIDIVEQIATGMDLELTITDQDFDGLQSGLTLTSGTCDLVASAMTITEDRAKNLEFSEGYYTSKQSLMVPEGSDIASIDDLAGKRVGVQRGTTGKTYAEENAPEAEHVSFPSDAEMFAAIQAGQVDALLQDLPVNLNHVRAGGYEIVEEFETSEEYGFAAKKGNTALIEEVDAQLQELRDSGEYQKIYDSYFKVS